MPDAIPLYLRFHQEWGVVEMGNTVFSMGVLAAYNRTKRTELSNLYAHNYYMMLRGCLYYSWGAERFDTYLGAMGGVRWASSSFRTCVASRVLVVAPMGMH